MSENVKPESLGANFFGPGPRVRCDCCDHTGTAAYCRRGPNAGVMLCSACDESLRKEYARLAAPAAPGNLTERLLPIQTPTHRCKVCGALWKLWEPGEASPGDEGSWSLVSARCGKCCDNVAMGDQIERILLSRLGASGKAGWSAERPDIGGWYWYRNRDTRFMWRPEPVPVLVEGGRAKFIEGSWAQVSSMDGEWLGPIPVPEE